MASNPLIAEINHAVEMLGMYRAELARILHLKFFDVSNPIMLEILLSDNDELVLRAKRFVKLYALLEKQFSGDVTAMANWVRRENVLLETTPLLAMVVQDRTEDIIALLSMSMFLDLPTTGINHV
jgi:hypothetical protein